MCRTSPISRRWRTCWCSTASGSHRGRARPAESGHVLELSARHITSTTAPYDLVRKMRASVLVLGPLVARCGRGRVSLPGGCAIGTRPVDLTSKGLERLGAEIELQRGLYRGARAQGAARRRDRLPVRSVGATENLLMAATLAEGETRADQRRARARDHRSGGLPRGDGRADRGHRYRPADDPRRRQPARRAPSGHPRPDRDRHLHHGGGGDRRRGRGWSAPASTMSKRCARILDAAGGRASEMPRTAIRCGGATAARPGSM